MGRIWTVGGFVDEVRMDPFEEFEFKPLTDGLGFHKKAEKLKQDIQLTNLGEEKIGRVVPEPPPKNMLSPSEDELDLAAPRSASKSISDLIAALPPSLDFLEDTPAAPAGKNASASAKSEAEPPINYPFLKPRKRAAEPKPVTSQGTPAPQVSAEGARPQIFQPLGRADYKSHAEKAVEKVGEKVGEKPTPITAPKPGTPATLSSANAATPISARANLPPSPTLKSPLKPGDKIDEIAARVQRIQKEKARAEKTQDVERKALAVASHELKKVSASFAAAVLDLMAISGIATIFLVMILVITRVDLVAMLSHAKTDLSTIFHLALLFFAVMQMYVLTSRCFFGATVGEWAFDLQMGTDEDRKKATYALRVIWRMILVLATGIVTLPLLSKLFGRDLLAMLGGPQLYRRPM